MRREPGFERAIDFARQLIGLPSPSGGEGAVAACIRAELEALRFDDVWSDGIGNVLGRVRGRGDGPSLMLSCHMDVVDPGAAESWLHPPEDGTIADGFLYGRGAVDVKGSLALQLHAAATFFEPRPQGDLYLAFTVLEEEGGIGMAYLMERGELRPDAVVLGEATAGDLCVGHRGRAELVVELRGESAHASAPERGRNPLSLLPATLEAMRRYDRELPRDPVLGRATLTPTAVVTPARQNRNVVPELVQVFTDCRLLPGQTAARMAAELRRALKELPAGRVDCRPNTVRCRAYTALVREFTIESPPFLLPERHPVVRAAAAGIAAATGRAPKVRPWGFSTDGGHSCGAHGIPTVGYGPGDETLAHTSRERLDLRQARETFAAYPTLIRWLQSTRWTDVGPAKPSGDVRRGGRVDGAVPGDARSEPVHAAGRDPPVPGGFRRRGPGFRQRSSKRGDHGPELPPTSQA